MTVVQIHDGMQIPTHAPVSLIAIFNQIDDRYKLDRQINVIYQFPIHVRATPLII